MVELYNFLASWQLFPEKGNYETGERPKNGFYKLAARENRELSIEHNWVSLDNKGYNAHYTLAADGSLQIFNDKALADQIRLTIKDSGHFEIDFYKNGVATLNIIHHILPNGYLKIIQNGTDTAGKSFSNTEIYHKQMSVLPYAASVSGAVIKPTEEGVIKHQALTAMEEQTNMQLDQIRKQIELLALQAQEIQHRKELSMMIYAAKLSFKPNIGQTYFLYTKQDDSFVLSLISPKEWGNGPFKKFEAAVKLLADHTWIAV
jgi:Protein of unknown function (DUF2452)